MTRRHAPCRTYIIYHSGLFAEGMRSMLVGNKRSVQIVGMERAVPRALKAVASLKPDVIIAEESPEDTRKERLDSLLRDARAGRVVRLSLEHAHAVVYERHQVPSTGPADLIKAIRGVSKQSVRGPDHGKAPLGIQSDSGRNGDKNRPERQKTRVRRTRGPEAQEPQSPPQRQARRRRGGERRAGQRVITERDHNQSEGGLR